MRDSENNVVVGDPIDEFRISFHLPFLCKGSLTAWTGAVVAGDSMAHRITAFLANADIISKLTGFTLHNTFRRLLLLQWEIRMCVKENRIELLKRIADQVFT